jgi:nucleotide-binding universal stress UspA family protein
MSTGIKTLMVDAGLDDAAEARVRLAAALAGRFGARLVGLVACAARPPVMGPFGETAAVAEIVEAEVERVRAALQSAADRFEASAKEAGVASEWRSFLEYPAEALARECRAADLVVLGRGGEAEGHQCAAPGDVLMRAGRPILVAPPGVPALEAKTVLVAWKETREARRAVVDALPFLVAAERVAVLAVQDNDNEREQAQRHVEDVASMLSRHGVAVSAEVATRAGQGVTDLLLGAAGRLGADLVVAGGYGHPRLLEWVLGGVTRDLLARAPVCCLLSH